MCAVTVWARNSVYRAVDGSSTSRLCYCGWMLQNAAGFEPLNSRLESHLVAMEGLSQ